MKKTFSVRRREGGREGGAERDRERERKRERMNGPMSSTHFFNCMVPALTPMFSLSSLSMLPQTRVCSWKKGLESENAIGAAGKSSIACDYFRFATGNR
jgi:hypothetical protein